MSFVVSTLLIVGFVTFAIGLLSGRPWTVAAVLAALSLLWLLVRSPIGPIGPTMTLLSGLGAIAGGLVAHIVRMARGESGP